MGRSNFPETIILSGKRRTAVFARRVKIDHFDEEEQDIPESYGETSGGAKRETELIVSMPTQQKRYGNRQASSTA